MAGNNQHHIWQMLQRGFGNKRGKDYHVWVYSRNEPPRQTVTRLFGVEKHFYGPEGSLADLNITKYENDNQSAIQEIRNLPNGSEVDQVFAANLIAHLEMRTAFLREDASKKMQKGMDYLLKKFTSPKELKLLMLDYIKKNPAELEALLAKEFIHKNQYDGFNEIAYKLIETMPENEVSSSFNPGVSAFRRLIEDFPALMNSTQNKVIAENEDFPLRAKLHMKNRYSVLRLDSDSFILPDTTLAFIKKNGASPFIDKNDEVSAVILPISRNVAIIGNSQSQFSFSIKALNIILAGCSFKSFIAGDKNTQLQSLTGRIGKYAKLISDRDLGRIVKSAASTPLQAP